MTLNTHLHLGTPLIWVNSDEPERVIDDVIVQAKRKVFKLDPFDGLVVWFDNSTWRKVLVELPNGAEGGAFDFAVAFGHVFQEKGIFIIPNAHKAAEELLGPLAGLYDRYRNAVKKNSADELPCQLVLISCTGEIPPEVSRHVAVVNHELPSAIELASIVVDMTENIDKDIIKDNKPESIIKAALGLSESEFTQAALSSIRENDILDPVLINDFKMSKIKAGGVLEIRNPQLSLDHIGGLDRAKEIISAIVWSWQNTEEAAKFGITPIRRMLLVGIPGTGKSAICEATAKSLDLELAKFGVSSMMNKFIGESENNMRLAFRQIKAMAPLVCWMDELGRDLSGSGVANDGGTTDRVHGELLTGIQELPSNVLLMAAANRIHGIPPEMLRADRFDKIMFVGFPTLDERNDIFRIHLGELASEIDLDQCAGATDMFTGAEIKSLIQEVKFNVSTSQRRFINTDDILAGAPGQKNRLWIKHKAEMLDMYQKAVVEWDWASTQQRQNAELILSGQGTIKKAGNSVLAGI